MAEDLTQCSACRTLIPREKAAGMQPPLLCDGCRARQAAAHSPEFPFASFVRFKSAMKLLASALTVVAVIQFGMILWQPLLSGYMRGYHDFRNMSVTVAFFTGAGQSIILWNIIFPIMLLILRKALLAFSDMMSDMFVAAHKEKL